MDPKEETMNDDDSPITIPAPPPLPSDMEAHSMREELQQTMVLLSETNKLVQQLMDVLLDTTGRIEKLDERIRDLELAG
jgi:hypothetical protein